MEGEPALAEALLGRLCAQNDAEGARELLALEAAGGISDRALDQRALGALELRRWDLAAELLSRPGRSLSALSAGMACALTLDHERLVRACAEGLNHWGDEGRAAGAKALASSRELAGLDLHYSSEVNELIRSRSATALARFESALLEAAHPSAEAGSRRAAL